MGGRAFKELNCPRMAPNVYAKVKLEVSAVLQTIFPHVVVPTEMPEKADYGDIDFLISPSRSTTIHAFEWDDSVEAIKGALNTIHGRRGFLTPDCMYFAIPASEEKEDYWIQIDVKVCFKPELFTWYTFELNYASNGRIIGSMVKPLGLTIDPEGLHIRVEEMEESNFPGSMICVSKNPSDVLRIVGLDRRMIDAGYKSKTEMYESICSSVLFNPAHFAARLTEEKYSIRLAERAPAWSHFIKEWLPAHYTNVQNPVQQLELKKWYSQTRAAVRDKVFTMFPQVAQQYFVKRATHIKELEEHRLRSMIMEAMPVGTDGWKDNFPRPAISIKQPQLSTLPRQHLEDGALTPPPTPTLAATGDPFGTAPKVATCNHNLRQDVPLYLEPLDRTPPFECTPHLPPANMSLEAKLLCLARWTHFDPQSGALHLLHAPHRKDFEMNWAEAAYAGATDEALREWARSMWWQIWIRQSHVNFNGMWKRRFERENRKAEKASEANGTIIKEEIITKEEVPKMDINAAGPKEAATEAGGRKILERLKRLNLSLSAELGAPPGL